MPDFFNAPFTRRWLALPLSAVPALLLLALLGAAGSPAAEAGGLVTNCANDSQFAGFVATGGNVSFSCGGAPVTITVSAQNVISLDTTIDGGGLVTLSGADATRLFSVSVGVRLTLLNLRLVQGFADSGGAVYNLGTLHVAHSTFYDNQAASSGAGIYSQGGQVVVTDTDFITNTANWAGGIYASGGSLRIQGGSFRDNLGQIAAGAVDLSSTPAVIDGATFEDNWGLTACCGALFTLVPITITNSVFQNNVSMGPNGGGALGLDDANLAYQFFIRGTQFIGNRTLGVGDGGAIHLFSGRLDLDGVTFEGNQTVDQGPDDQLSGGALFAGETPVVTLADTDTGQNGARQNGATALAPERPAGAIALGAAVTIRGSSFISNTADFAGGAIYSAISTTLSVDDSTFIGNLASESNGGAIANYGRLMVADTSFIQNRDDRTSHLGGGGGAIFSDYSGDLKVFRSEFRQNHSAYEGGAIDAAPALVQETLFLSNTARYGGAIDVWLRDFHILNSAFIGNGVVTTTLGDAREGGAIDTNGGSGVWITNSTFFGNYASGLAIGGAIQAEAARMTVTHGTFYSNTAATGNGGAFSDNLNLVLRNSIVANNPGGNCQNLLTFTGANLQFGDTSCGSASIQQDPLLAPLPAWLGGPTPVVALLAGSPAIDAATEANCTPTDQRGFIRPYGPACDLGAFEAFYQIWAPILQR